MNKFNTTLLAGALSAGLFTGFADATIVTLETSVGNIDINLYDETTPATVTNFLAYVNDGRYDNTFIHRSYEPLNIVQGGGYTFESDFDFEHIETFVPVVNEPKFSNVRGTISMAKISGQPNSATSEFFFNLADNTSGNRDLDASNGGFTVFGQLTEESLALMDGVADLLVADFRPNGASAFDTVPLKDITAEDLDNQVEPTIDNFVMIYSATVSDAATDTAAGLNPVANPNYGNNNNTSDPIIDFGGGHFGIGSLLLLGLGGLWRRFKA